MNELNSVHPAFVELLLCAELGGGFAKYSQPNRGKKFANNHIRLCVSNGGGLGSVLGQGNKIPCAIWHGQKIKRKKENK